ncbi:MAG: acyl--CoA ligase, partial [Ignavibacteria bacterium]|nr:acyl--CoA ligase [Ignavibacteria bacterium]
MSSLSDQTRRNILAAQTVGGIPPTEPLVPYRNIGDLLEHQVDRYDDKPYLIFYDDEGHRKEYSYREFFEEVCRTANYLRSVGVGRGDRIATVSHNHADVVLQYFACFLIGAAVVPINVGEDDRRVLYILKNSGVRLAFVRDQYVDRILSLRKEIPSLEFVVVCGSSRGGNFPFFGTVTALQPVRFTATPPAELDDECLIVYTSGTTGNPKGVVLSQYNL